MKALTEAIIGFLELLEAEGRLLQRSLLRTVCMAVLLVLGLIFGATALGFFFAALYQALILVLHPAWALCILGLVCLAVAGGLICVAFPKKSRRTP